MVTNVCQEVGVSRGDEYLCYADDMQDTLRRRISDSSPRKLRLLSFVIETEVNRHKCQKSGCQAPSRSRLTGVLNRGVAGLALPPAAGVKSCMDTRFRRRRDHCSLTLLRQM
ncbi:hypothetical protein O3P69_000248 [Scylla paramamosain]|uniref:Uncharacterized protein n=1 Tax=Scylla paramamosain TaxID=85552 RepID=A0AAW0UZF8_SCYPA